MNDLVLTSSDAVVPHTPQTEEMRREARELFAAFRAVFSAENLRQRAVFWFEERRGKLILRHVRNLERHQKSEDQLVGMTVPNINAAKVLMGNFADRLGLSTVRWELYSNFELTDCVDVGRFDHVDLLSDVDQSEAIALASQGVVPSGRWDFDCILATHICPKCNKVFDRKFLIYCPFQQCESCGYTPTMDDRLKVAQYIAMGRRDLEQKLAVFPLAHEIQSTPAINFANPIPNSFAYLFLASDELGRDYLFGRDPALKTEHYGDAPEKLCNESLFALMRCEVIREGFHSYLASLGEDPMDWEMLTGALFRIGELMRIPDTEEYAQWMHVHSKFVQFVLPVKLNDLIKTVNKWSQTRFLLN